MELWTSRKRQESERTERKPSKLINKTYSYPLWPSIVSIVLMKSHIIIVAKWALPAKSIGPKATGKIFPSTYSRGWEYSAARAIVLLNSWCYLWIKAYNFGWCNVLWLLLIKAQNLPIKWEIFNYHEANYLKHYFLVWRERFHIVSVFYSICSAKIRHHCC